MELDVKPRIYSLVSPSTLADISLTRALRVHAQTSAKAANVILLVPNMWLIWSRQFPAVARVVWISPIPHS